MKIYATDVDEEALTQARQASYSRARGPGRPDGAARAVLRATGRPLRLPQGPAPSGHLRAQRPRAGRADLADRPARLPQHADVLQRRDAGAHPDPLPLRAADAGVLFLGKAEMLLTHGALFVPDRPASAGSSGRWPDADQPATGPCCSATMPVPGPRDRADRAGRCCATRRCSPAPLAQVVVTADGGRRAGQPAGRAAVRALGRATSAGRSRTSSSPTGRSSCAATSSRRRPSGAPCASPTCRSSGRRRAPSASTSTSARWSAARTRSLGVSRRVPRRHRAGGCRTSWSRPTASSRPPTRSCSRTNEELETTNEELQSTVEELETTNEELQSTNEELETMNEELQSTNEELQTINDELRDRTAELDAGQRLPGVDPHQPARGRRRARPRAARAGVEPAGRGALGAAAATRRSAQHFLNLDIGLPLDLLRPAHPADAGRGGRAAGAATCPR